MKFSMPNVTHMDAHKIYDTVLTQRVTWKSWTRFGSG